MTSSSIAGMSGPSGKPRRPGSGSPRCPTGSPPARTPPRCRRSVTGSAPGPSTCSSSGGCTGCRCLSPPGIMTPATGGRPRCGRWRSPAPWSSMPRAMPAASSRRWSPTTWTSAGRTTWRSSSPARSAATPKGVFRTAIDRRDNGGVLVNVFYKHSRIKQYLKNGRALRVETVVNAPGKAGLQRPPAQPGRAPGQGPRRQPAHTGNRTCRPGHRPCEPSP